MAGALKKKIRIIINPISGIGKQKGIDKTIASELDASLFDIEISFTEKAGHAISLAKDAANKNYDIVAIVGGDGSVNEAASGLVNTNTALAIIPAGSGNGFARHLKIPLAIKEAVRNINNLKIEDCDTAMLNEHFFINVAGIGFDGLIAHEFAKQPTRGFKTYVKTIVQCFSAFTSPNFTIQLEKEEITTDAFLISIANASQYGNRATIAPKANHQDGLLNLCVILPFPNSRLPEFAFRLMTGSIHKFKYYNHYLVQSCSIKSNYPFVHLDGEPILVDSDLKIKTNPNSIKIVV